MNQEWLQYWQIYLFIYIYIISISPTINKLYKSKFITGCGAFSSLAFLTRSWLLQNLGQCSSQAQAQEDL